METKVPFKIKGGAITGVAGVGTSSTDYTCAKTDGKIIGISVGETDTLQLLSHTLLSATQGDKKPLVKVPLNNLLPTANRLYFPVDLADSGTLTFDLQSLHASTTLAKPPVVVLHFDKPTNS